jgi:tRNA/tmRNA/rRNA uracil-C5-methylase (TrmA/RlmC/RlmD family)
LGLGDIGRTARAGIFASRSHDLSPIQKTVINDVKNTLINWANQDVVPPYDEVRDRGVLRHILARQSVDGSVMAGVVVHGKIEDKSFTTHVETVVLMSRVKD